MMHIEMNQSFTLFLRLFLVALCTRNVVSFGVSLPLMKKPPTNSLPNIDISRSSHPFQASVATDFDPRHLREDNFLASPDVISQENPLRVVIAGAGVGGLALAKSLSKNPLMNVTVLERTEEFRRFGGPIQLASNALQIIKEMDQDVFDQVMEKFTFTGDKDNGIKDGIRNEWYAKFDLGTPAKRRNLPYTGTY